MNIEAVKADPSASWQRAPSARPRFASYARRLIRSAAEAGYDAIVWVCGLSYAAWVTGDLAGHGAVRPLLAGAVVLVSVLSVLSGLLAGLYRGRHARGSLDEVISVFLAGGLMLVPLLLSGVVIEGQRDAARTVAGGALIALPTIAVARYVLFTAGQGGLRRRKRPTDGSRSSSSAPARRGPP